MSARPIEESLCTYDVRNPDHATYTDEDCPPRQAGEVRDCSCDNCYYGRHRLAEQLIAATAKLEAVDKVLTEYEGYTGAGYTYIAGNIRKAWQGAK